LVLLACMRTIRGARTATMVGVPSLNFLYLPLS